MSGFLRELSERNVVRVAVIYALTGWLLIQVAAELFPLFGIPEWANRLVVLLVMLGFPISLILAWALELTPEGIKRAESSVGEKRMWAITILLAALAVGWFMTGPGQVSQDSPERVVEEQVRAAGSDEVSIAVLPFLDLSENQDQEYFALGMSEELLNLLAKIDVLEVASRTSAFAYQGSKLSAQEIGQALGVAFVLEGSVRKSGNRLRITAQLIDAGTDRHLWSDNYDRTTADLFEVQDQIATAIVEALKNSLQIDVDSEVLDQDSITENMTAYELYLEGREAFNQRQLARAISALERAVELDPGFAQGWAQLAASYVVTPGWIPMERPYIDMAVKAARRALELDDELAMAHLVLGSAAIPKFEILGIAEAVRHFERARELEPRNPTVLLWTSVLLIDVGYFDRARELLDTCVDVDPAYFNCWRYQAGVEIISGNVEEGVAMHAAMMQRAFRGEQLSDFAFAYLEAGNEAAASLVINRLLSSYGVYAPDWILLYRDRQARPKQRERLIQQLLPLQEEGYYETYTANTMLAAIGRPELIRVGNAGIPWFWLFFDEYRNSGRFYQDLQQKGVLDYWDLYGPPSFCRKTGKPGTARYACDLSAWER